MPTASAVLKCIGGKMRCAVELLPFGVRRRGRRQGHVVAGNGEAGIDGHRIDGVRRVNAGDGTAADVVRVLCW